MNDRAKDRVRAESESYHDRPGHGKDEEFEDSHLVMEAAVEAWERISVGQLPPWATTTLDLWRARLQELLALVHAAPHALSIMPHMPSIVAGIHAAEGPSADADAAAHRASELSDLLGTAQSSSRLAATGFRLLFVLGTVWLWASFEALVDDIVMDALSHAPPDRLLRRIRGLKIRANWC